MALQFRLPQARKCGNGLSAPDHFAACWMLNHTGGTCSHSGMMDYPRIPNAELNLGKFPDSMEFQTRITMHWIKEVEIAKSIDELMTSRSIVGRTDFPDFDMLYAMIASALKKLLNTQMHFRKRVSLEEQRVQKHDRFLRGRQIAYMIYEYFRATGTNEAVTWTLRLVHKKFTE